MNETKPHPAATTDNGVMTVTLRRPEKLNAMRTIDYEELLRHIEHFRDNNDLRVFILTGEGRAFCAGDDLAATPAAAQEDPKAMRDEVELLQQITRTLYHTDKATIAAVNGVAVGFGVEVTLSCDIRFASEEAYFWLSEAERGLLHTNGCFHLLPRIVGAGNARAMIVGGEKISAQRALEIGLVYQVLAGNELPGAAHQLAQKICGYSGRSLALAMTAFVLSATMQSRWSCSVVRQLYQTCSTTEQL